MTGLRSCRPAIFAIANVEKGEPSRYVVRLCDVNDDEVRVDLTVTFEAEKGLADLTFLFVDRVHTKSSAVRRAVEGWMAEHEREVFRAVLEAC